MKYLFGPVPSRRLGISLGVDLVPHKVCSLNCVYCEVGRTTNLTIERKKYIPINEVIAELKEYLKQKPELDFVTFSGQGEPTLNSGLGKVIDFIKDHFPQYKVAVITNGTLFWNAKVRAEVARTDVLLPSLDAVSRKMFLKINRPSKFLEIKKIIAGLVRLKQEYEGKINLEIFLIPHLNDTEEELLLLKEAVDKIKPDLIQLNTLDRPGTVSSVKAVSRKNLLRIKSFFEPLPVEIIAKPETRKRISSFNQDIEEMILETIKRRPCTDKDLTEILNLHQNELNKYLSELIDSGKIISEQLDRGLFFKLRN
ncbi:MAG: radical SAM protein [Candidatus Cloacimonetes bacterium]|nr:radical SAM protein [Candidatus Cloacimonadota bacterium]MCF7813892.1 radical SAM protein [Candidatus Cloacimonadota bacterium]MCF7868897.1 radical SAM protein [Candidatus Cloacimonadota bacterium]MCF7884004.1 radical SAM protein [Candidatus Cloacimonadota bacterium]